MINLKPEKCNVCGGQVVFTDNSRIYGKSYGSGKCYLCTECCAYVSTHEPRPEEAMGLLANDEMRDMRVKCHDLFDRIWRCERNPRDKHIARVKAYKRLASDMGIDVADCHFGHFSLDDLYKAHSILVKW